MLFIAILYLRIPLHREACRQNMGFMAPTRPQADELSPSEFIDKDGSKLSVGASRDEH